MLIKNLMKHPWMVSKDNYVQPGETTDGTTLLVDPWLAGRIEKLIQRGCVELCKEEAVPPTDPPSPPSKPKPKKKKKKAKAAKDTGPEDFGATKKE